MTPIATAPEALTSSSDNSDNSDGSSSGGGNYGIDDSDNSGGEVPAVEIRIMILIIVTEAPAVMIPAVMDGSGGDD